MPDGIHMLSPHTHAEHRRGDAGLWPPRCHGSVLALLCGLGPFPAAVLPFLPLTCPSHLTEPQLFKVSVQPETHMASPLQGWEWL